jgi:hypothetical protein
MSYLGISADPVKDIQLKTEKDVEFEWPAGDFYLHYPVYKRCVVGFGKNGKHLGKAESSAFNKEPCISQPADDDHKAAFEKVISVTGGDKYTAVLTEARELFESGDLTESGSKECFTKNSTLKEKVKLFGVGDSSCWVITESNKIFYKGASLDYHFPNDEECSNFKELTKWTEDAADQVIT